MSHVQCQFLLGWQPQGRGEPEAPPASGISPPGSGPEWRPLQRAGFLSSYFTDEETEAQTEAASCPGHTGPSLPAHSASESPAELC